MQRSSHQRLVSTILSICQLSTSKVLQKPSSAASLSLSTNSVKGTFGSCSFRQAAAKFVSGNFTSARKFPETNWRPFQRTSLNRNTFLCPGSLRNQALTMLAQNKSRLSLTSSRASPKLATVSWLHFLLRAEAKGKGVKFSMAYLRGPARWR